MSQQMVSHVSPDRLTAIIHYENERSFS